MYILPRIKKRVMDLIYDTDDCIEAPYINESGYGYFQATEHGKNYHFLAHRVAYQEYYHDNLNPEDLVCHKCDNPKCFNPKHLFKGTNKDNSDDKCKKGRQAKGKNNGRYKTGDYSIYAPSEKRLHPEEWRNKWKDDEKSFGRKITKEQVLQIREYIKSGKSLKSIASIMNIKLHIIKDISCGRTYRRWQ